MASEGLATGPAQIVQRICRGVVARGAGGHRWLRPHPRRGAQQRNITNQIIYATIPPRRSQAGARARYGAEWCRT